MLSEVNWLVCCLHEAKEAVTTLQISHAAGPLSKGEPLVFIVKRVAEVLTKLKADLYLPRSK